MCQDSLPAIEQAEFQALDGNATKEALIGTFIFLLPISLGIVAFLFFVSPVPTSISLLAAIVAALINLLVCWWTIKSVALTGIAQREHDLLLKRGVFWRKVIAVPFNRIQHIETHRNPFERKLKLATLKLFTAGGAGSDLEMHGLALERASKLRQHILTHTALEIRDDK